jgi:hypothetical protein
MIMNYPTDPRRHNPGQLAPGPDDLSNRYHTPVYETIHAKNRNLSNRTRRVHAELRAEEGTWRDPAISGGFVGGSSADQEDHHVYEVKRLPEGRTSRLGQGRPENPTWAAIHPDVAGACASASSGDQENYGTASPDVAYWRGTLAPTFGMGAERPGNIVVAKIPPATGGRGRRNLAEVEGRP